MDAGFESMIDRWLPLTYVMNNLSRGLGLADAYPFVLSTTVIEKFALHLRHHQCVPSRGGGRHRFLSTKDARPLKSGRRSGHYFAFFLGMSVATATAQCGSDAGDERAKQHRERGEIDVVSAAFAGIIGRLNRPVVVGLDLAYDRVHARGGISRRNTCLRAHHLIQIGLVSGRYIAFDKPCRQDTLVCIAYHWRRSLAADCVSGLPDAIAYRHRKDQRKALSRHDSQIRHAKWLQPPSGNDRRPHPIPPVSRSPM